MSHLPSGFGVPQWPLSFDQLGWPWMLIPIAAVILLGVLLLLHRSHAHAGADDARRRSHPRRPWRIAAARPPRRLRRVV